MANPTTSESYEQLGEASPRSIVWASNGPDGSGKSDYALSAPGPIFVYAFDPYGMNRVRPERKRGKNIRIARYPFDPLAKELKSKEDVKKAAEALWKRFRDDFDFGLNKCRSLIIDREDMYFKLQRYKSFGDDNDAPSKYDDLYTETAWLIQKAQSARVNLGILRGMKEKWVSKFDPAKGKMVGHNTGELIPDGTKKIPDLVDVTVAHRWDPIEKAYMVKIGKFPNKDEKDAEYPDFSFADMGLLAYPDSTIEDWQ